MSETGKRIVAIGRGDTITLDNGWAQLDDANKSGGHYQKKQPDLIDARNTLALLEQEEITLIDRMICESIEYGFLSFHPCKDFPRYTQLQGEIEDARGECDRLYAKYNGQNSEGTFIHISTIAEKVPECVISERLARE
jgi:hypothetical protein